jgi:hypothetical protein
MILSVGLVVTERFLKVRGSWNDNNKTNVYLVDIWIMEEGFNESGCESRHFAVSPAIVEDGLEARWKIYS